MGVETKRMAKSMAAAADNTFGGVKSWPERIKSFYNDVRAEMKKVTSPTYKEVQATTVVVIVTVFLFAFYFWVVDNVIGRGLDQLFRYFTHR